MQSQPKQMHVPIKSNFHFDSILNHNISYVHAFIEKAQLNCTSTHCEQDALAAKVEQILFTLSICKQNQFYEADNRSSGHATHTIAYKFRALHEYRKLLQR